VAADWSKRGEYIIAKHQVAPQQANEALADPERVVIDPDYTSKSGIGIRTIGYSTSAQAVLTVITVEHEGIIYGATAFKATRDLKYYNQGGYP
jgi:hypothetical protein